MKRVLNSFTVLYCEIIWMYFTILLFSNHQWVKGLFPDLVWWFAAGIGGYVLHTVIAGRLHFAVSMTVSALLLGFFLVQNWISLLPGTVFGYNLAVSAAVIFSFVRGAGFVYRPPTRLNMLGRFETNIILYLVFLFMFSAKQWLTISFHAVFLFAAFASLLGLIQTMQNQERAGEDGQTEIRTVGQAGWFAGVLVLLIGAIILLTLLLLLPSIREGLYIAAIHAWEGIVAVFTAIGRFFVWLISLIPVPDQNSGELPPMDPADSFGSDRPEEEEMPKLPLSWVIGGLAAIGCAAAVVLIAMFLKQYKPAKPMNVSRVTIHKTAWWQLLLQWMNARMYALKRKWRSRFPRCYLLEIYWLFRQLEVWGHKNGLTRTKTETPKEYTEKIISRIDEVAFEPDSSDEKFPFAELLRDLGSDYQSAYYGQINKDHFDRKKYGQLIQWLNTFNNR